MLENTGRKDSHSEGGAINNTRREFENDWPSIDAQSWPTEPKEFAAMVWKAATALHEAKVGRLVEALEWHRNATALKPTMWMPNGQPAGFPIIEHDNGARARAALAAFDKGE